MVVLVALASATGVIFSMQIQRSISGSVVIGQVIPRTCGDQNGDGDVNVSDVIIDLQITVELIMPTSAQTQLSDLNRDGTVNVLDAIIGLQYIVGLIPALDECGPK